MNRAAAALGGRKPQKKQVFLQRLRCDKNTCYMVVSAGYKPAKSLSRNCQDKNARKSPNKLLRQRRTIAPTVLGGHFVS